MTCITFADGWYRKVLKILSGEECKQRLRKPVITSLPNIDDLVVLTLSHSYVKNPLHFDFSEHNNLPLPFLFSLSLSF